MKVSLTFRLVPKYLGHFGTGAEVSWCRSVCTPHSCRQWLVHIHGRGIYSRLCVNTTLALLNSLSGVWRGHAKKCQDRLQMSESSFILQAKK